MDEIYFLLDTSMVILYMYLGMNSHNYTCDYICNYNAHQYFHTW